MVIFMEFYDVLRDFEIKNFILHFHLQFSKNYQFSND